MPRTLGDVVATASSLSMSLSLTQTPNLHTNNTPEGWSRGGGRAGGRGGSLWFGGCNL
jgi:Spy/CpxP family protein refolding chaperone